MYISTGIHHKLEKVGAETHTRDRIPGSHSGHCANATETTRRENETDSCRSTDNRERRRSISPSSLTSD